MKRLLFIAHRVPYPPDKGERVRAFHQLRVLAHSGRFRIVLAALADDARAIRAAEALKPWCQKLLLAPAGRAARLLCGAASALAGRSVTEGFFRSRRLARLIAEEAAREPFDLVLAYSSSMLPYALTVPARGRIMDLVDVDSAKWAAYAEQARRPMRWLYAREAAAVAALERRAVEGCDAVIVVSRAEAELLPAGRGEVVIIGNGVDTDYFAPQDRPADAHAGGRPSLVFTGQMDYRPNVDGVCWFVREVWPELRRRAPELTLTIVGRNPTRAVRRLGRLDGLRVTGAVPDVRPYLAEAAVAICPLQIARGVQNKVLEAMAMGLPVVASSAALTGLDLDVGREVLRADSPAEWRQAILGLLSDEPLRRRIGQAARGKVVSDYEWGASLRPLLSVCESVAIAKEEPSGARTPGQLIAHPVA